MDVEEAAESSYGLIARTAALAAGMSSAAIDRRIAAGRWLVVHPGVYRVRGAPVTARQRALAAVMWAGRGAAVSHLTGGRLLRLDGVPRPRLLDVSIARPSGLTSDEVVVHRTTHGPGDVVRVDGIPCTSATRTVIDLAALLDDEALTAAFERARRLGLTSVPALAARAEEICGRGRAGSGRVRRLLAEASDRPLDSMLEVKVLRELRAHGVEPPTVQLVVGPYRIDLAWPLLLVGVECDGFEWHGDRLAWKRDRRRSAFLEARGWRIVHVTWDDVTRRPAETVERVTRALRERAA